jgi:phosphoserine phosphatase RsbU/P
MFPIDSELAQNIQKGLLPASAPVIAGLDIGAVIRPHYPIGGDFYDFILEGDQLFTFIISDICGKGASAAMMMTMTRLALRIGASSRSALSPEEILIHSNALLYEDFTQTAIYASVFLGRYDSASRMLVYANAGQSPVIFMPAGGKAQLLIADGAPIGVLPASAAKNHHLKLNPGDLLVVGTDGLAEAYSANGNLWSGYHRLLKNTEKLAGQPARVVIECLFNPHAKKPALGGFRKSAIQNDDQTLVVIKCT